MANLLVDFRRLRPDVLVVAIATTGAWGRRTAEIAVCRFAD
ncbi:MAG TPA: hypothetical protein VG271_16645 [Beijerinckiaceae bacterium]|jgi:hypothetical protein|nr:hypothetical protein [Beijerinckiaceae bacterium]